MKEIMESAEVENLIYEINGKEVMLDTDLAKLYQVETKRINEAVRNNPEKFPGRFSFILSNSEVKHLRSKFSTANISNMSRVNPRVFTEQGVYMLATILKSKVATQVSIRIMDAFVKMRHYINYNKLLLPNKILLLETKVDNNTKRIDELFDKFNPNDIVKDKIYFEGEFYDAFATILSIFDRVYAEIIIIDNYLGKEVLNMVKDINKRVIMISKIINKVLKDKYESQYNNVTFINSDTFHDRFIIIDREELYHCGASFKDLGKKCFAINQINDKELFLDRLNSIIIN